MALNSIQNTNYTFRLLYVLAIFMIIDGHIGSYDYLSFNGLFPYQNYHIALFVFVAGYFINLSRSYSDFIIHKLKRLILPLYLWNLVYGGLAYYLNTYHGFSLGGRFTLYNLLFAPIVDGHQFIYNMASWFLVPLFLVQLISFIILKPFHTPEKVFSPLILCGYLIISLLLGFAALQAAPVNEGQRTLFLTCLRTFYFLVFYAFGVIYHFLLEKHDTLNTPLYLTLILIATICLRIIFPDCNIIPSWLDFISAPVWSIYAIGVLATLFWLRIAKIFTPVIKESPALNYISTHTFDIMMHHFIGFMLIKAALSPLGSFNPAEFKQSIWYYHFPFGESLTTPLYIIITLVIALFIGFTSRQFCNILNKILKWFFRLFNHSKKEGFA